MSNCIKILASFPLTTLPELRETEWSTIVKSVLGIADHDLNIPSE